MSVVSSVSPASRMSPPSLASRSASPCQQAEVDQGQGPNSTWGPEVHGHRSNWTGDPPQGEEQADSVSESGSIQALIGRRTPTELRVTPNSTPYTDRSLCSSLSNSNFNPNYGYESNSSSNCGSNTKLNSIPNPNSSPKSPPHSRSQGLVSPLTSSIAINSQVHSLSSSSATNHAKSNAESALPTPGSPRPPNNCPFSNGSRAAHLLDHTPGGSFIDYLGDGLSTCSTAPARPPDLLRQPSACSILSGISINSAIGDQEFITGCDPSAEGEDHHTRPRSSSRLSSASAASNYLESRQSPSDSKFTRRRSHSQESFDPLTPRTGLPDLEPEDGVTDTILAKHVRDIQVPETIARQFRQKHSQDDQTHNLGRVKSSSRSSSGNQPFPQTTSSANQASVIRNPLTLKEQNSKLDRLSKENFDLKLKIYFLDQALHRRSDEGVREVIQHNVQLQKNLANEKKENLTLRRRLRESELWIRSLEAEVKTLTQSESNSDLDPSRQKENAELHDKIRILDERLKRSLTNIEKLTQENVAREAEKRNMAAFISRMQANDEPDRHRDEKVIKEAMDMWKDLLEAETARREQADEDAQKLREELKKLRSSIRFMNSSPGAHRTVQNWWIRLSGQSLSEKAEADLENKNISNPECSSEHSDGKSSSLATSSTHTMVEKLLHENAELRRDLGAQTSMLSSRNRERERLQAEIENLKIAAREVGENAGCLNPGSECNYDGSLSRETQILPIGGSREMQSSRTSARDSSVIQAHSDGSREFLREMDGLEHKLSEVREELSMTRLINHELERELNMHLDAVGNLEKQNGALTQEKSALNEDVQALLFERDELLIMLTDKEAEYEDLRAEGRYTIEKLENELDHMELESRGILRDLQAKSEDFSALQLELRDVSESVLRLEDDNSIARQKIISLDYELNQANRALATADNQLREMECENKRLGVQVESLQEEISFLHEEQERDKLRIGDAEEKLAAAKVTLSEEKEKLHDLELRLESERSQREVLDNQEKAAVHKVLQELNMQATKSKQEIRRLQSTIKEKEAEVETWTKDFRWFESELKEALKSQDEDRSSMIKSVASLRLELEKAMRDLGEAKKSIIEKDELIKNHNTLLDSTTLENHRLSGLLEKERLGRNQDRQRDEQIHRNHQAISRTVRSHETKMLHLETTHHKDTQKLATLEARIQEVYMERNKMLLSIWNRLSKICGNEWLQKNGPFDTCWPPSHDWMNTHMELFGRKLLQAVKTIEGIVSGFRKQILTVEKDLRRDYQALEDALEVRVQQLEHIEKSVAALPSPAGTIGSSPEGPHANGSVDEGAATGASDDIESSIDPTMTVPGHVQVGATSKRHRRKSVLSVSAMSSNQPRPLGFSMSQSSLECQRHNPDKVDLRWTIRLRELENRLYAEREARVLERSGARKRIEEGVAENLMLRSQLAREKEKEKLGLQARGPAGGETRCESGTS